MSLKSYPPLPQHDLIFGSTLGGSNNQNTSYSLSYKLARLHHEKNALSKGLADCVTYLKVLREKQIVTEHRLQTQLGLPRKKRKWLQQTKRHVDNEIKHRERDEQAFLNNLQACETNIFLTNIKAYHGTDALFQAAEITPTPTLYASPQCSSYSGSDITDLTWDGWTDETVISPFQKQGNNPFMFDEVAPDVCTEVFERDPTIAKETKRPPPLWRGAMEFTNSIPVPPNTAHSQFRRLSNLNPEAVTFEPTILGDVRPPRRPESNLDRPRISSATAISPTEVRGTRWFSAADIYPISQEGSVAGSHSSQEHPVGKKCCEPTPQQDPQRSVGVLAGKHRANSL
jgi:hypothetical protein